MPVPSLSALLACLRDHRFFIWMIHRLKFLHTLDLDRVPKMMTVQNMAYRHMWNTLAIAAVSLQICQYGGGIQA